jgi:hypothetical protein
MLIMVFFFVPEEFWIIERLMEKGLDWVCLARGKCGQGGKYRAS